MANSPTNKVFEVSRWNTELFAAEELLLNQQTRSCKTHTFRYPSKRFSHIRLTQTTDPKTARIPPRSFLETAVKWLTIRLVSRFTSYLLILTQCFLATSYDLDRYVLYIPRFDHSQKRWKIQIVPTSSHVGLSVLDSKWNEHIVKLLKNNIMVKLVDGNCVLYETEFA